MSVIQKQGSASEEVPRLGAFLDSSPITAIKIPFSRGALTVLKSYSDNPKSCP